MFQNLRFETNGTPYCVASCQWDFTYIVIIYNGSLLPYGKFFMELKSRLTIVSREAKKKLYELFTCSTALKLANALTKPPLKLSLSYYRPTTFLLYRINKPRMEEIGATIPKYQPLRVLWRPLCDYA